MQTWAKRGIQTVLVTGGVLMLGTGIAAADDTIDPDAPPSALDATVKVPVRIDRNAIGTPVGSRYLPSVQRDITVAPGTAAKKLPGARHARDVDDLFKDNQAVGTLVVPAKATGNAVALGGDVSVADDSTQHAEHHQDVHADGADETLAGNVVRLAYSLPIDVSGNAVAVADDAEVTSTSRQTAINEGDVTTAGDDGVFSGNVFAAHGATPVQATGNAASLGGTASSTAASDSAATAGGAIKTSGVDSVAGGDAGGIPVAVPVRASGNTITKFGIAESASTASSSAHAGDEKPDLFRVPTYIQTDGNEGATGSGNGVQAPVSGPVALDCNGLGELGNTDAQCQTGSTTSAGGGTRTFGDNSVASGIAGTAPVVLPVQGQGNCGALAGNCDTAGENVTASEAGGDTYTRGHDSVLGGSSLSAPVAGPVDLCGNVAGAGGLAAAGCGNTSTTKAGGNTGTTGDDSVFGGTNGSVPVAFPVEGLGNVAGAVGDGETSVREDKVATAGGGNNTNDEAATGGANLVTVPVAGPVQAFGNGAGVGGNTESQLDGQTDVTAGGPSRAKGTLGTLSGNIAQAPVTMPAQAFGSGATLGGNGRHVASNATSSTSGGHAVTDGDDGNISGNLISTPVAGGMQTFGVAGAVAGDEKAVGANELGTTAGGNGATNGANGNIAGNIVGVDGMPVVQAFGDGVAVAAADATGLGANRTQGQSGGHTTTSGQGGHLAGNAVGVPAATLLQPHGSALGAGAADGSGASDNVTTGAAGAGSHTDGDTADLSGHNARLPVNTEAPVFDVPVEVLADAIADGKQNTDVTAGEKEPMGITLPKTGTLEATKTPPMPNLSALPYPGGHRMSRFAQPDPLSTLLGADLAGSLDDLTALFNPGPARANPPAPQDPLADLLGGQDPLSALLGGILGGQDPVSGLLGAQNPVGGLLGGQDPVSGLTGGQDPVGGLLGGQDPVSGLTGGQSPVGGLLGGQDPVSGLTGGQSPV
ncbi:beta strand repeat-containing protein, partial [Actinokineospora sp. NPDC004072]